MIKSIAVSNLSDLLLLIDCATEAYNNQLRRQPRNERQAFEREAKMVKYEAMQNDFIAQMYKLQGEDVAATIHTRRRDELAMEYQQIASFVTTYFV